MTKAKETALPKAFEGGADPDAFRLPDAGGALIEGAVAPLGGDRLLEGFRWMPFSRALDERAVVGVQLVGPLVSELAAGAALAVPTGGPDPPPGRARGGGCAARRTVGFRARGRGGARGGDGR